jgi:hypothetical protein
VKNYYPNHQTVTVDSYEEFIPLCTNEPVLSDLLDRVRPLHHSVVGEDLLLIYEAAPAPTSKVTVEKGGCLTTQLSVVARIQGEGSSYVRTLAGATRLGKMLVVSNAWIKKVGKFRDYLEGNHWWDGKSAIEMYSEVKV